MRCRRVLVGIIAAVFAAGCAPKQSAPLPYLDPTAPLDAPPNLVWLEHHRERFAAFESAARTTVWPIAQELHGRLSTEWPPPTAPLRWGPYEYYSEDAPGQRYPIVYRRPVGGAPEPILDLNRAFPSAAVDIGAVRVSPDHTRLAVTLDLTGAGDYKLFTRGIPEGDLVGPLANSVYEAEWGSGGDLFFTTVEGARATRLHRLTANGEVRDLPLPVPPDGHLALRAGGANHTVTVKLVTPDGGAVWTTEVKGATLALKRLNAPRLPRGESIIDGCLFPTGRMVISRSQVNDSIGWLSSRPQAKLERVLELGATDGIEGVRCFGEHALVVGRRSFRPMVWGFGVGDGKPRVTPIAIPRGLTELSLGANTASDDPVVRLQLSSLVNPPIVYSLDLREGQLAPLAQMRVRDFDPTRYTTAMLEARTSAGDAVPITVAYRADQTPLKSKPVVLTAYGAYGVSASTEFSPFNLPLLDRGFVVAVAHVRGGGEGGAAWHNGSRGIGKFSGVTDLIAAAETLKKLGWGADRRIAVIGRSAGAVVVASAASVRPDLFGTVVLDSPFLDLVGGLTDDSRPLAVRDRAEWGDPRDPKVREAMKRYAPFELPLPPSTPPTLTIVGINDTTVPPLDGARWIDRLEHGGSPNHLIAVRGGAHGGADTRTAQSNLDAVTITFILERLGAQE